MGNYTDWVSLLHILNNNVFLSSWSQHVIFALFSVKNCIPNESINILLVSHKQYWWAAEQSYIPSFLIRKVLQVANYLFVCFFMNSYHCFFPLSVQLRRRYVKTYKEKGDDKMTWQKKKTKIRHWVVLVRKPQQRPAVLWCLQTSKRALSYMKTEKALFFFETQLTSSAVKFFLFVVNLKVSRYQHNTCVYLFRKSDPQIQRYTDTDNLS